MKVLVIGATGNLGSAVVQRAMRDGHEVSGLSRHPPEDAPFRAVRGDVREPGTLGPAISGQDAVIYTIAPSKFRDSTLRTEGMRNTVAAMTEHGARRLIAFSAYGVGDSREKLKQENFLFGRVILPLVLKAQFEDMHNMEEVVRASGLDWTIVRPTALSKKPATGDVKVALDREGKVNHKIPYADVAAFMVDQLGSDTYVARCPVISAGR